MRGIFDNSGGDRIRQETPDCAPVTGSRSVRLHIHSPEVTIILTDITLPLSEEVLSILTPADLEYADRFTDAGRRAANLTWRAALRAAIKDGVVPYTPATPATPSASTPADIRPRKPETAAGYDIEYSPCGAPFIAGNQFRFGVSHTSDKAALILADTPCAIDIERADRDFSRVAARILTDKERKLAARCNKPNAAGLMWCAKETIYKLSASNGIDFRRDIAIERIDTSSHTIDGRLTADGRARTIRLHYLDSAEHFIVFATDNIL